MGGRSRALCPRERRKSSSLFVVLFLLHHHLVSSSSSGSIQVFPSDSTTTTNYYYGFFNQCFLTSPPTPESGDVYAIDSISLLPSVSNYIRTVNYKLRHNLQSPENSYFSSPRISDFRVIIFFDNETKTTPLPLTLYTASWNQ